MVTRSARCIVVLLILALVAFPLAGCGATATSTAPAATAAPTKVAPTTAPPTTAPTAVPPTTAPTATPGPTTGGKLVYALQGDPDTLDVQKSAMAAMSLVMRFVGDCLVDLDPDTGEVVPYLADSWSFSSDGLTWTFKLHPGVKFHDGTPVTAQDWAWTLNRAIDPATKSTGTGPKLAALQSAEATDGQTLVLHLKVASFYLLRNLAMSGYASVLPQAAVTKAGDAWGRSPSGSGPFKFVSWQTGNKITLQRNPDYKWYPGWNKGGGPYIDTIEFRIFSDLTTVQAGIESGDVDFASIQAKDVARTKQAGTVNVMSRLVKGISMSVFLNVDAPLLSDLAVRQALAYAVDRSAFVKMVFQEQAVAVASPLGPAMLGYDKVQETYAQPYDVAKAKSTLAAAGYSAGPDGIMQRGGASLKFNLIVRSDIDASVNSAQILQQQWKAIGVDVQIQKYDAATVTSTYFLAHKYDACVMTYSMNDATIMALFRAPMGLTDAKYNAIFAPMDTTLDPAKQQEAVNAICKFISDGVYMISFSTAQEFFAMSSRVKGFSIAKATLGFNFLDAYIPK